MKNEHTKFYTVTLATAPIGLLAVIAKITKPTNIYKTVNRNGNRHEVVSDGHYHVYKLKASIATIIAELERRIALVFGEHSIPTDIAVYAISQGCESKHIHIVEAGPCSAHYVSGTYFGSGSYCANFRTNGTVEEVGERDTGFAVEHHKVVHLKKGQCLFNWQSASPGRNFKEFFIAA